MGDARCERAAMKSTCPTTRMSNSAAWFLPAVVALRVTPVPIAIARTTPARVPCSPRTCSPSRTSSRSRSPTMLEEPQVCTEENVAAALADFKAEAVSMFGCHPAAAAIGITGDIQMTSMDGPFVTVKLVGRFWHRRKTVLTNAEAYVRRRIPEVVEIDVAGAHVDGWKHVALRRQLLTRLRRLLLPQTRTTCSTWFATMRPAW